ncbi:MAG: type II 3-dehydroquinate dehydratase [Prevotellaceae bacterium]|jgi:3-dehydroquinate dehydratase-2|nr:type II 3-dehydroquinate dehydratase [Prevotellaceae bacterium]
MTKILIINGANLNLLGRREPQIYGHQSFDEYFHNLQLEFPYAQLAYFQSNSEGTIIDKIQAADGNFDGIVLNAGAYAHTSLAIADAVRATQTPVIEVHISNIFAREPYRHHSFLSEVVRGVICGFGMESYRLAVDFLVEDTRNS